MTLDYATAGSTATSGLIYGKSGSIRMAAEAGKALQSINDSSSEGNETFTVSLSNLTNAAFGRSQQPSRS